MKENRVGKSHQKHAYFVKKGALPNIQISKINPNANLRGPLMDSGARVERNNSPLANRNL